MEIDQAQLNELPPHLEHARTRVGIGFKAISNPTGTYGARAYHSLGFDNGLTIKEFRERCKIEVISTNEELVLFDVVGVDAPIANALRRIMLSEVPTIAIETVFVHRNTSIMHDEQLAHRLGLVPLKINPKPFQVWEKGLEVTPRNTVKFRLKVRCEKNRNAPRDGEAPPDMLYTNSKVLSGQIEYVPFQGNTQADIFRDEPPHPVHDDILLCKLRPGQDIHVEMNATKHIGREHAKWSPVCTASYRMLPEINLKEHITGSEAKELVNLCPAKVFDIEDDAAIVARPRDCTVCRECIREDKWRSKVQLTRKRDHFIFSVEGTGAIPARYVVTDALTVLMRKCDTVLKGLNEALQRQSVDPDEVVEDVMMDE